jgi:hypothetical protein
MPETVEWTDAVLIATVSTIDSTVGSETDSVTAAFASVTGASTMMTDSVDGIAIVVSTMTTSRGAGTGGRIVIGVGIETSVQPERTDSGIRDLTSGIS